MKLNKQEGKKEKWIFSTKKLKCPEGFIMREDPIVYYDDGVRKHGIIFNMTDENGEEFKYTFGDKGANSYSSAAFKKLSNCNKNMFIVNTCIIDGRLALKEKKTDQTRKDNGEYNERISKISLGDYIPKEPISYRHLTVQGKKIKRSMAEECPFEYDKKKNEVLIQDTTSWT